MGTIAEKLQKLLATKDAIKTAIISKGQPVADSDTFASYADKIAAIQTGIDISDATAYATDVRSGKIAYGKRGRIVGMAATVEAATPTITIDNAGNIAATTVQADGFVMGATKRASYQMPVTSLSSIAPSAQAQTFQTEGTYNLTDITVSGDANLKPENIKDGVTIFGVTGTAKGSDLVIGTYTGAEASASTATQDIALGFKPKMVIVLRDPSFISDAPWYHYEDTLEDGTTDIHTKTMCAWALDGVPCTARDSDGTKANVIEITDTGFRVRNAVYKKTNTATTIDRRALFNYSDYDYSYIAIP